MSSIGTFKSSNENVYIPPQRRNMNNEETNNSQSSLSKEQTAQPRRNSMKPFKSQSYLINLPKEEDTSDEIKEYFNEYADADECSIIISCVDNNLSENQKQILFKPYYDKGGISHWISSNEVLFAYATQSIANSALSMSKSSSIEIKLLTQLNDSDPNKYERCFKICKELLQQAQPERNTKVASRLIGAALGIRVPLKKNTSQSSSRSKNSNNDNGMGAWDD